MGRTKILKDLHINSYGKFVLYWMQSSQRVVYNLALYEAINKANEIKKPLVVLFVINENFPYGSRRNFLFMLEGLKEVYEELHKLGIKFVVHVGDPVKHVVDFSKNASILIMDVGYTKLLREWRKNIVESVNIPVLSVEDNVIVPVEIASNKEEYAAYTIRRKIQKQLNDYLKPLNMPQIAFPPLREILFSFDVRNPKDAINRLHFRYNISETCYFKGGYSNAKEILNEFIQNKLPNYFEKKNDFSESFTSNLSPYLHFGQISPIEIALSVLESSVEQHEKEAFLEELIIRRELAFNFVYYNPRYDRLEGLEHWEYETLQRHKFDIRTYRYSFSQLENAETHDPLFNAAMTELVKTGKMHGYLRMYWGKKVIEWSESPDIAFKYLEELNNKYALDGRDPNSYAGIAWCFGKHDRPFKERPIFGKVRYMSEKSIYKKFDVKKYIEKVKNL
ncbi:deoxyribodipyrimidine photo-lyase [Caldisericum exile]|uniref:Deoxyribodipyrimidine photo-lyase n=1 Tax=Caldisericum exile (strain DSM 21853 / NBRC 104410 / AZM16c01) TaxID=511051 RepID=A0A7U6JGH3_CALEA|nr:deoxyribodipyrimidine photo-lyase [Caldisericum exile]BAL81485.1 deoxyribodipyrimidine photo-lyase [Caldisericum exile AZM16c01]